MDPIVLSETKNKIIDLLQSSFNEYVIMNESKIQQKCELDLQLKQMSDTIRDQEKTNQNLQQQLNESEKNTLKLQKQIHEYETMINNLQEKMQGLMDEKEEENRFDIIRVQANELMGKDREIERLHKLLSNKNEDKSTIDLIIDKVEEKVNETKNVGGWAPTTSKTPEVKVEEVKVEEGKVEEVEEEEDIEVEVIKYKNKEYFYILGESEQNVYHILDNDEIGPIFGKWKVNKNGAKRVTPTK